MIETVRLRMAGKYRQIFNLLPIRAPMRTVACMKCTPCVCVCTFMLQRFVCELVCELSFATGQLQGVLGQRRDRDRFVPPSPSSQR